MNNFQRSVMALCLSSVVLSGGTALAQVGNSTPNGDAGSISTPSLQNDTQLSTPTGNEAMTEQVPVSTGESTTKIEVDMPDVNLPDVTPQKEVITTREKTESTFVQTDNNDNESNQNTLYLAILGIVAVFLVAVVGIMASRRDAPYQP